MSEPIYLVIAYRWGQTNNHWYVVYCGQDNGKGIALGDNERQGRGGKYGVAVYEITEKGECMELRDYYPSGHEKEPFHSHAADYFERLGHMLDNVIEGRLSVPNEAPDENGITGMHRVAVDVDPILRQEVARERHRRDTMQAAMERAREEKRAQDQRMWCPLCDCAPVYRVEYSCSFWRVARDECSGFLEVEGLDGCYCMTCGQMHLYPEQIATNEHRIWMARHKAATAELQS